MNLSNKLLDMYKTLKKCSAWAVSITIAILTFVPEKCFSKGLIKINAPEQMVIILNRIFTLFVVLVLTTMIYSLYRKLRKQITIKGNNYSIQVEYGDLFQMGECKKIIAFDECFTTSVGAAPSDVNPDSICGQFLQTHPVDDIQAIIETAGVKPAKGKSKFQGKPKYDSGRLVPHGDFLLLAFAKLNQHGTGELTQDEFLECLSLLWTEIEIYYGQKDVCLPILGSGVTRMGDESLTQQKLLNIIINSYKLSPHKIKLPNQLHIVCKKADDFSISKLDDAM